MNAYSFFARGFTARLGHDFSFGADYDYTYADLARDTARVARWLTVQGLRGGDRVLAIVEPSRSSIVAYLGCLRAGAVWVPVAASSSKSEIERVTELTEPRLALSAAQISALDETVADKDSDEPAISRFEPVRVLDETPAAILWAPGGRGVMLSHWHLMEDARLAAETWKIDATDAIVHRAPITDRFGLSLALGAALRVGARFALVPTYSARNILRAAKTATVLVAPTDDYARLLDEKTPSPEKLKHLRVCLAAGEPLDAEAFEAWTTRVGAAPVQLHASAEAGLIATSPLDGERRPGTLGLPPRGVQLRIVNRDGKSAKPGDSGALEAKCASAIHIFWRAPDALSAISAEDGYMKTGFAAQIAADGYLTLTDGDVATEQDASTTAA